jgi:hypothetical protein
VRPVLVSLIVVLCVAAAAAIVAIVTGEIDDTVAKVAWTTFAVPVYFSTGYVQRPLLGRGRLAALGWLGVAISAAGFLSTLELVWVEDIASETAARVWGSLLVASIAMASIALLVRGRETGDAGAVSFLVFSTLAATTLLAGIVIYVIAAESDDDTLSRAIAVAGVLWALGIVLLPLARKLPSRADARAE